MLSRWTSRRRLAGLSLLWLVVASMIIVSAEAEKKHFGTLIRSRGEVTFQPAGAKTWHTASERMNVGEGDKLKTGPKGQAVVRLSKDNFLSLGPNAEITLNQSLVRSARDPKSQFFGLFSARIEEYELEVDLKKGQAVNMLQNLKGKSDYRLVTPVAVAGVRGTIFAADVQPGAAKQGALQNTPRALGAFEDGKGSLQLAQLGAPGSPLVNFSVIEGSVNLTPIPGGPSMPPMTLLAGQSLSLSLFTAPSGPEPITPTQAQNINTVVTVIEKANTEASSDEPSTSVIREESVIQLQQESAYNN